MKYKFLVFFSVLIIVSCKTTRTISKTENTVPKSNPVAQVIDQIQKAQPQFTTANVSKMTLEMQIGDRNVNVSASCKIRKDSALYLSVQPFFGIELFKAEFTTDGMRVFDKANSKYYVADYSYFRNRFGVDVNFYSLQSLLTGQFFCVGEKEIPVDKCRLIPLSSGQSRIEYINQNMTQTTDISLQKIIQQILVKANKSGYQLQTNYSDYQLLKGVNFPQKINVVVGNGNKANEASCNFSILRVEFNTDIKFIPSSTERFVRGDLDQLLAK